MSKQLKENKLLHIATIGKTVGIKGDMKFHIKCDFPEQFKKNSSFLINKKDKITLTDVNLDRGLVKINGLQNLEDCKKFTNAKLYTSYEQTREDCHLEDGENFWFDIEDCKVYENDVLLGVVHEVERLTVNDYLSIKTDDKLVNQGLSKSFLVPFISPFKVSIDVENQIIIVSGAMDILEAS
ncbi:MAG: ribosome maturation factor RimM [Sulfurimonas sp.]